MTQEEALGLYKKAKGFENSTWLNINSLKYESEAAEAVADLVLASEMCVKLGKEKGLVSRQVIASIILQAEERAKLKDRIDNLRIN